MSMICDRTFLSAYVKHIVVEIWKEKESNGGGETALSYEEFSNLFDTTAETVVHGNLLKTKEDFECAIEKLCPLFQLAKSLKYQPEEIANISDACSCWMEVEKRHISQWFEVMTSASFPEANLCYLQIFAVLERALGNIFLVNGKQCPFLLRDLVQCQELEDTFGATKVKMLKLLLGGPLSLNLRNLFWHGFVSENEVPSIFYHFLVFLVVQLSKHVLSQNLLGCIKRRPLVRKSAAMDLLKQRFEGLDVKQNLEEMRFCFRSSPFVPPAMLSMFIYSLDLYALARHGECVMTLLPRIEHLLRCRFAICNDCPDRMMTAQSSDYYTTIDHVLEETLSDGRRNKLRGELGDEVLVIIMDLFTLNHGLRLRDHLSHGEMNSRDVDENLAAVIVSLAVTIARDIEADANGPVDNRSCDLKLKSTTTRERTSMSWWEDHVTNYEALFHSHSFVKRDVTRCCQSCAVLDQSLLSRDLSTTPPIQLEEQCAKLSSITSRFVKASLSGAPDVHQSCDRKSSTVADVLRQRLITLYRSHPNDVVVRQIACEMTRMTDNITQQLRHGSLQYDAKLMRSRKRKNFCRFVECLPVFSIAMTCLSAYILLLIHDHDVLDAVNPRKLKKILQICENSTTYTSPEVNKWDECVKCIMNLCEILPV